MDYWFLQIILAMKIIKSELATYDKRSGTIVYKNSYIEKILESKTYSSISFHMDEYRDIGYFINCNYNNDILFKKLKIDKQEFQQKILGYKKSGGFPYCRTIEDAMMLFNELLKMIIEK